MSFERQRPDLPVLALTQGDPAGIGPEILLKLVAGDQEAQQCQLLLIAEKSALERARDSLSAEVWKRLSFLDTLPSAPLSLIPTACHFQLSP